MTSLGIGFGITQTAARGRRTVNTDPVIALSGDHSVDEGTAANTTIGTASIVNDPGYGTLTWSLTDTAGSRFKINSSTGVVATDSTVTNFEDATSHNITIKAVDGVLPDLTRVINILVNNVAPTITSDATFEAAIGDDGVLYSATATEPGDDPITFSLTGTTDFVIDPDTGEITFVDPDGIAADDYVFTLHASDGTDEDTLEITASVAAAFAPTNTVAPAITGTEEVGETLTCSTGTWTGTPVITYAYQWFRAVTDMGEIVTDDGLMVGVAIDGETASTYDLAAEDEDEFIFCEVTATNGAGSAMAQSNATGAITSVSDAAETTAFLARTSGLDATHTNAYKAYINGLVAASLFAKFDALWLLATQDSTTAGLNLIGNIFNLTPTNSPTFTADSGYAGNGTNSYLATGFNPATASSPKFTQDDAHFSVWNLTNAKPDGGLIGNDNGGCSWQYFAGSTYPRVNDGYGPYSIGADQRGHLLATRLTSTSSKHYLNGTLANSATDSSVSVFNGEFAICAYSASGGRVTNEIAMASIGGKLTGTEITDFYNLTRAFMTAVGVP